MLILRAAILLAALVWTAMFGVPGECRAADGRRIRSCNSGTYTRTTSKGISTRIGSNPPLPG